MGKVILFRLVRDIKRRISSDRSVPRVSKMQYGNTPSCERGDFGERYFGFRDWCTIFLGPSLVLVLINDFKLARELFGKDEYSGRYLSIPAFLNG